ncbi:MAG: hypothetical protein ABIK09_12725 [Pseudomonadota bacterium]
MASKSNKRHLKNLLIDKQFQLKYVVLSVLVSVLIFAVLGWLYVAEWEAGNRIMKEINPIVKRAAPTEEAAGELEELKALTEGLPMDEAEVENLAALEADTAQAMEGRGTSRLTWLVASVGLLVVFMTGLVILLTHRAAGPVYAIRLFVNAARIGAWNRIRPLRDGDEFIYLGNDFLALVSELKAGAAADLEGMDQCLAALEAGDTAGVRELLGALRTRKANYLEGKQDTA